MKRYRARELPGCHFRDESGYSLVEVLVAIVILAVAILPMVGMFESGLKAANTSGNYDKARSLATLKLEQAKTLPYDTVNTDFPTGANLNGCGSGCRLTTYLDPEPAPSPSFDGLEYRVEKQYLEQPPVEPGSSSIAFRNWPEDAGLMKITVTVEWGGGSMYGASGVVSR